MNAEDRKLRQEKVLEIVIQAYILTATPVSSRYVSRKLALSSATIRNVMADLEDMGLIGHPHTSAGRIPSDKGYRFYVDSLMRLKKITEEQARQIESEYHSKIKSLEDMLDKTAHILSRFTNYVGITFLPKAERKVFKHINIIPLLTYPEFKDHQRLINILKFLEEKESISDILFEDLYEDGLKIRIGSENKAFGLDDFSVITAGFKMENQIEGRLGVVGPTRMNYERVIPVVDLLAGTVTKILSYQE